MNHASSFLAALAFAAAAAGSAAAQDTSSNVSVLTGVRAGGACAVVVDGPNGFAYVYNEDADNVSKLDVATRTHVTTAALPAPSCPHGGARMVLSDLGGGHLHLWVYRRSENKLFVMEVTPSLSFAQITGTSTMSVPTPAEDLVIDNKSGVNTVFLACPSSDQVVAFRDSASHGTSIGPAGYSPVATGAGSLPSRLAVADMPSAPNRLFIAPRGTAGAIFAVNTSTGALTSQSLGIPSSPPNFPWDVAFDGDPSSGKIFYSVRASMGDGIAEYDPLANPPSQTNSFGLNTQIGATKVEDVAAYRNGSNSRVMVLRPEQTGTDGGKIVVVNFPQPGPTPSPSVLGTQTIPLGISLNTTSTSGGGSSDACGDIATDPAADRFYVSHGEPFHVHMFNAGFLAGDLRPFEDENNGAFAVASIGGANRLVVTQVEDGSVAVYNSTITPTPADPPAGRIEDLPSHVTQFSVNPVTHKVVFTTSGKDLHVVDGRTHAVSTVTNAVPLGGNGGSISAVGNEYVFFGGRSALFALNTLTNAITSVPVTFPAGEAMANVGYDPATGRIYVGSYLPDAPYAGSGRLFVINGDPSNAATFGTVVAAFTINAGASMFPCDFKEIVVNSSTGVVYALDEFGQGFGTSTSRIFAINGSTGAVLGTASIGRSDADHGPEALALNRASVPAKLYVGVSANITPAPFVRILNASDLSLIGDVSLGTVHTHFGHEDSSGMEINESTGQVYIPVEARSDTSPSTDASIKVIDASNTLAATLTLGVPDTCMGDDRQRRPRIALNRTTGILYAAYANAPGLFRFNGTTPITSPALSLLGKPEKVTVNRLTGIVHVGYADGTMQSFGTAPTISSFSPTSGAVGDTVTITGTGLGGVDYVSFGGVTATSFSTVGDTSLTAVVPAGALSGVIQVSSLFGLASSASAFTVSGAAAVPAPTITGFSPSGGGVGTSVTVTGTDFTGVVDVEFNGVSAPFSVVDSSTLSTSVPAGATPGPIIVVTPGGVAVSASPFLVVVPLLMAPGAATPGFESALAGTSEIGVLQIAAVAGAQAVDISGLEFFFYGSATPGSDVTGVSLWEDVNANGVVDFADVSIGTPSFTPFPSVIFSLPTGPGAAGRVAAGSRKMFLVALDLGPSAPVGATAGIVLYESEVFASNASGAVNAVITGMPIGKPSGAAAPRRQSGNALVSNLLTVGAPVNDAVAVVEGGSTVDDFIMFTPSLDTGSSGFQQLEAQFGQPGTTGDFRLFRFDPTTGLYDEFGTTEFTSKYPTMCPGFGWWLIARNASLIQVSGTSMASLFPNGYSLTLHPGWNQIGNPYDAPLVFQQIGIDAGAGIVGLGQASNTATLQTLYRFQRGSYIAESAVMEPRVGYWVKNLTSSDVLMLFDRPATALKAGGPAPASRTRRLAPGEDQPPAPPAVSDAAGLKPGSRSGGGVCFAGTPAVPAAASWLVLALLAVRSRRPRARA